MGCCEKIKVKFGVFHFFYYLCCQMQQLRRIINRTLSVRLSLMVVSSMAILLMASLVVMLYFSRKTVKEEALQMASQTLEGTVQCIDNILLSVEQTTGNFYFSLLPYLNSRDSVLSYSRRLVESNPYVMGCAIAFKPGYYPDKEFFMAYVHHTVDGDGSELEEEAVYDGEYIEQPWFSRPILLVKPGWQKPMTGNEADEIPIMTFCLPLPGPDSVAVGVMGIGVSLSQLSKVIAEAKPSANSSCMLIDGDGTFIVHPDNGQLIDKTATSLVEKKEYPSVGEITKAMLSGKAGYNAFKINGSGYYIFYKPYKRTKVSGRSMEELNWSIGIVYPEKDIFGDYDSLLYYVLAITLAGLLLLFLLSHTIIKYQLKPLLMLAGKAQRISEGHYDEIIPDSRHSDEIGRLQHNFRLMQKSLASNIGELDQLTTTLQLRGEGLRAAYNETKKADRMKTAFLHNMTNQMIEPAYAIDRAVEKLCAGKVNKQTANDIQQNGNTIAELLNNLINISDDERLRERQRISDSTSEMGNGTSGEEEKGGGS